MKSTLIRTAIATSLLTALVVSGISLYAFPRLTSNTQNADQGYTLQPAVYHSSGQDTYNSAPGLRRASYAPASYSDSAPVSQPVVRKHRSTGTSVMIVAGSSAAGAGIGALAGERVDRYIGIGAVVIVAAVALVTSSKLRRTAEPARQILPACEAEA